MIYTPCGWDICFYMMGTCSMLWTVAWFFLAYDNPRSHPNITEEVPFYPNFTTSPQYLKTLIYICAAASDQINKRKSHLTGACRTGRGPCWLKGAASSLARGRNLGANLGNNIHRCLKYIWFVPLLVKVLRLKTLYLSARSLYTPEIWACLSQVSSNYYQVYSF